MPLRSARIGAAICGLIVAAGLIAFAIWGELFWTIFIGALLALAAWVELRAARAMPQGASDSDRSNA